MLGLLTLISLNKSYGQWAPSGNNIYNTNTGNVGIGNNAPSTLLYVAKNMTEPTITVRNMGGAGGATYTMTDNLSGANWKFKATATGGFKIRDHANGLDVFTIESNSAANSIYIKNGGKIGMGTTVPNAKLHVYQNDRALIVDGYGAINTSTFQGLGFQYYLPYGEATIQSSFPGGYGFLTFYTTNGGSMAERMRITYEGRVGIGTTIPDARLHVLSPAGVLETAAIIDNFEPGDGANGLSVSTSNATSNAYVLNAVAGSVSRFFVRSDGNVGIGTTTPAAKLQIYSSAGSYVNLGSNQSNPNYFHHAEDPVDGDSQTSLFGYRTRTSQNDGINYSQTGTNQAIKGYSFWGDVYTFGVSGFSYNDYSRTGGVLGADVNGLYWGSLGYRNSGLTNYGGYFTSSTIGAGKKAGTAMIGVGMGAWGDLFGADIHGKIYGTYTEGENYAIYAKGDVYNDKLDIHLQDNGTGTRTVLYTNTSTDVTVQTSGKAVLSGGRAMISFSPAFAAALSSDESLVITITPIGESNGVYLDQVTKSGFSVVENNGGRSNVTVNYIAIGKRAGYENPSLAQEVISADYDGKVARGLHSDADTQTNGDGLYYENGKLVVGVHPSNLPDPNKPAEEKHIGAEVSVPTPASVGIDPATMPNIGLESK
jgi:hypothetical protein